MKRIFVITAALVLLVSVSACTNDKPADDANVKDKVSSGEILKKAQTAQPVPQFGYSQIRQTLIDAQTAQANSTQTTSFFFINGVPDPTFTCPSIGFPVAGTSQLTNPEQLTREYLGSNWGYNTGVIKQIDPNGIYSGDTSATFVLCVEASGKPYLHHAEEIVHAVAGPAVWDKAGRTIKITGDPTFKVNVGKK